MKKTKEKKIWFRWAGKVPETIKKGDPLTGHTPRKKIYPALLQQRARINFPRNVPVKDS